MITVDIILFYNRDRGFLDEAKRSIKNACSPCGVLKNLIEIEGPGKSAAQNLNEGIRRSHGEFIKYICEDDLLTSNSIADSVEFMLEHPEFDFIHGNAMNFFPDGTITNHVPSIPHPTIDDLTKKNSRFFIHGGSLMYRRRVFERAGLFDESLTCGEELEMNLRALSIGMKIGYLNKPLYMYRRHAGQKSLGSGVDQSKRKIQIDEIKSKYRKF